MELDLDFMGSNILKAFGFRTFWFSKDSFDFLRFGFFQFFSDRILLVFQVRFLSVFIGLVRQQYKDAKPCMLSLTYSTRTVKPSIFGIKSTIDGFSGWKLRVNSYGIRLKVGLTGIC